MKVKIGPGISDITLTSDDGAKVFVGRDPSSGKFINELGLTGISFSLGTNDFPRAVLECELFGQEHEMEIKGDYIVAKLHELSVASIEMPEKDIKTDADIHPDA